jgi:hypothetical protein
MKKIKYVVILLSFQSLFSQIFFDKIPINKQLVPRDLTTNQGTISIEGEARTIGNDDLSYDKWDTNEPNNAPVPENVGEIINSSGDWNDADSGNAQSSYVEYDGLIISLSNFVFLGQYNGHSYFRNPSNLTWDQAKTAAENAGGYLSSHQTAAENSAVASFNFFRGWIGLYQDQDGSNYSEPDGGWKWVTPSNETFDSFDSITVKLYKNDNLINSFNSTLNYQNDVAPFNFQISIDSELSKYSVEILTNKNSFQQQISVVNDIVAGDVFVIQGQSNATALAYNGSSNSYLSDFIRVFSAGHTSSAGLLSDNQWHYGQGDGNEDSSGNTGQWGLVLAKKIINELQIPIAIFNSADGGKPISFFQRPADYQSSTSSNYGRLYYRLNKTELKDAVRAILWSQGEADSFSGGLSTSAYKIAFNSLKNSWLEDYQSIEQIFIFQTRDCDCGTISSGRKKIKEAQRQLAKDYDNIYIMGTSGISVHSDNCHFPFSNGYELFGQRIFKPLMKSIYNFNYNSEIDPPLILSVNLTQTQTLVIETSSNNLIAGSNNYSQLLGKIQDDFVLTNANGVSVNSFQIQGGDLILGLNGDPGTSAKISFIGKHSGTNNNIVNNEGLELVCFSDFPIFGESNGNNNEETPALVFVNVAGDPANGPTDPGRVYINSARGAARDGNGNSNAAFGNIGDWAIDMVVSELSPEDAANSFGGFTDDQHAKLDYGGFPKHYFADNSIYDALIVAGADPDGNTVNRNLYVGSNAKTQYNNGLGALGWGSFGANAYNRASGVGSVAMGFNNIAGRSDAESNGITGDDIGQAVFGYASRATGNISFAAGFRNTASGQKTVAMGNFNNASGDSSVAIGKDNYAQGASTVAIGFQSHAAGDGSVALGQQNVSWGTTNFTAGYQNIAGDVTAARGSGGSAVAMGKYNMATADTSMALNRGTAAINQAATAMGFRTVADNAGMLAIGVNNVTGLGDTASGNYFYTDGAYNGLDPGVAFVIGNGDINTQAYARGNNPSNAFIVYYDGDATLSGDLTVNSDARLKSNIMSLGSTLAKLMKIDGKTYTLKSNKKENKIGLLAQEIEEVFPELVKEGEDKDGTLSVNYQGLIPVLINAIKEQQEELNGIRKSVNEDR